MNLNAANSRNPHKLGAKRLTSEVQIGSSVGNFPPPYNPYNTGQAPNYQPNPNGPYNPQAFYNPNQPQYGPPPDAGVSLSSQYLANPVVADAAVQYGQHLMGTGKQYMNKEIEKYVSVSRLKYYFAVDTVYVLKKLSLLFLPFTNSDWSVKYASDEPIQPRYEINAPDLYIPTMAYLTYVLVAGFALGTQDRFTPEMLGIQASSALAWTLLEVFVYLASFYLTNITTSLTTIDIIAFSGYKFVGIIVAVLCSIIFHKFGYYIALIYSSLALSFFLVRTLKAKVLAITAGAPDAYSAQHHSQTGHKRRLYLLMSMGLLQPVLMWWLSYHLVASPALIPTPVVP